MANFAKLTLWQAPERFLIADRLQKGFPYCDISHPNLWFVSREVEVEVHLIFSDDTTCRVTTLLLACTKSIPAWEINVEKFCKLQVQQINCKKSKVIADLSFRGQSQSERGNKYCPGKSRYRAAAALGGAVREASLRHFEAASPPTQMFGPRIISDPVL